MNRAMNRMTTQVASQIMEQTLQSTNRGLIRVTSQETDVLDGNSTGGGGLSEIWDAIDFG